MQNRLKSLWNEARVPNPPAQGWQDWLLLSMVAGFAVTEWVVRDNIVWPHFSLFLTLAFSTTLFWRRAYPALMVAIPYATNGILQVVTILNDIPWEGLYTGVFLLILPYSLLRWGSGKDAFIGLGIIFVSFAATTYLGRAPLAEIIGAMLFILFPSTLGASVRYQSAAQQRATEQVRLREREQLARELHDTVGHYVSAIAIQAQAGRALGATHPEASLEVLGVIEDAASKALGEMRSIVRAMRKNGDVVDFAPAASIADIEALADSDRFPVDVHVSTSGTVDNLDATITSTLFRLAQESITNAIKHADGASVVQINISGKPGDVELTVRDNGRVLNSSPPPGLGLQGMTERVNLLGGSLRAGPADPTGWIVSATIPRASVEA